MTDPTLGQIRTLASWVQPIAAQFIDAARDRWDYPAVIVAGGARRSVAAQKKLVSAGRSTTLSSKHVLGRAWDVDMYGWNRDDVPWYVYSDLGDLAHEMGVAWGGDWSSFVDIGHFEV